MICETTNSTNPKQREVGSLKTLYAHGNLHMIDETKTFSCDVCGIIFEDNHRLTRHRRNLKHASEALHKVLPVVEEEEEASEDNSDAAEPIIKTPEKAANQKHTQTLSKKRKLSAIDVSKVNAKAVLVEERMTIKIPEVIDISDESETKNRVELPIQYISVIKSVPKYKNSF